MHAVGCWHSAHMINNYIHIKLQEEILEIQNILGVYMDHQMPTKRLYPV